MKKILSLALAGVMMFSALPMAYAADVDVNIGTDVTVTGTQASEYEITVPATLQAGGAAGNVIATGTWKSSETLIVTTDDEVEVQNDETGATTMVPVVFEGINAAGNDLAAMSISKEISLEKGDVLFGEWTGHIVYNVELDDGMVQFTIEGTAYQAEDDMTWTQWVNSKYNTDGYVIVSAHNTAWNMDVNLIMNASKTEFVGKALPDAFTGELAEAAIRDNAKISENKAYLLGDPSDNFTW